ASVALGANTHSLGSEARERGAWWSDAINGYVVSGCEPTTSASTTVTAFACEGYLEDSGEIIYTIQPSSVVGPLSGGDGTYWLALHRERVSAVSGWTRHGATHYLWQMNVTQPANPSGGLVFSEVTVSGGAITAVSLIAPVRSIPSNTVASGRFAAEFGVVADDLTDNSAALQLALDSTEHITLPCGVIRFATTLSLNRGQILEGCSHGSVVIETAGTILRYTGSGDGVLIDGGTSPGDFNFTVTIRNLAIRSTTGATGLHIFGAADIDVQNVRVAGRATGGVGATGHTTAGILIDDLATGGISLVLRFSNLYVQANVGDGIKMDGLSQNLNQVSIDQSRIQGNLGWGINATAQTRAVSITGSDIEGNALGSIRGRTPIGWFIGGNYFEDSSPATIDLDSVTPGLGGGVSIVGNSFGGSGTNIAVKLSNGLVGNSVHSNAISGYATAVDFTSGAVSDTQLGPNNILFTTTDYAGRPGAGVTITRTGDTSVQLADHSVIPSAIVSNTAVETTIITTTIPGNAIDGPSGVKLEVAGEYTNNSGINETVTLRVRYKGTTIGNFPFASITTSPTQRSWILSMRVSGDPNNQTTVTTFGTFEMSGPGGLGGLASAVTRLAGVGSIGVATTTTSGDITVTVQHNTAAATISLRSRAYFLEMLPQ
ncbi:MAG: glycosyl hydrolase family 28-related protein, partial [Gammaproteobacteria bacterium]